MNVVWMVMTGVVLGVLAKLLTPGPNTFGAFAATMLLGVLGALVGGGIALFMGWWIARGGDLLGAAAGASVVLVAWNRLTAARRARK